MILLSPELGLLYCVHTATTRISPLLSMWTCMLCVCIFSCMWRCTCTCVYMRVEAWEWCQEPFSTALTTYSLRQSLSHTRSLPTWQHALWVPSLPSEAGLISVSPHSDWYLCRFWSLNLDVHAHIASALTMELTLQWCRSATHSVESVFSFNSVPWAIGMCMVHSEVMSSAAPQTQPPPPCGDMVDTLHVLCCSAVGGWCGPCIFHIQCIDQCVNLYTAQNIWRNSAVLYQKKKKSLAYKTELHLEVLSNHSLLVFCTY